VLSQLHVTTVDIGNYNLATSRLALKVRKEHLVAQEKPKLSTVDARAQAARISSLFAELRS
jgi:hypothetical protein